MRYTSTYIRTQLLANYYNTTTHSSEFQLFSYTTGQIVTCMHVGILHVGCLVNALLESFLVADYFICNTVMSVWCKFLTVENFYESGLEKV